MGHQHDANAQIYDAWHTDVYQTDITAHHTRALPLNRKIIQYLSLSSSSAGRLLDVACGKGIFLMDIASACPHMKLSGTDISSVAVRAAKKIVPDADVVTSHAEALPYKDHSFNYVTCIGGLEYFPQPVKSVAEMARVLKKGGRCVVYVPNLMFIGYIWLAIRSGTMPTHGGSLNGKTYYDFTSERFFTLKGWEEIISRGGMNILSVERYDTIGSSKYASSRMVGIYDKIVSKLLPKTLAYCYLFTCTV